MNVIHISAECYPIAKVGGLADVVGSLPKYQQKIGMNSNVVMPYYDTVFSKNNAFKSIYKNTLLLGSQLTKSLTNYIYSGNNYLFLSLHQK
mgnify:CR=1 FL=1